MGSDEKKQWDRWVQQSTKNRRLARRAQAAITEFSFAPAATPHTSQAWNRLQRGIAGRSQHQWVPASQRGHRPSWIYYGVAASMLVIIVAGLSGLLMYSPGGKAPARSIQRTIQTAYGERKEMTLSNGVSIVLNAHSTLTYGSNQPADHPVQVTLRGEAYFATVEHAQPARRALRYRHRTGKFWILEHNLWYLRARSIRGSF